MSRMRCLCPGSSAARYSSLLVESPRPSEFACETSLVRQMVARLMLVTAIPRESSGMPCMVAL